MAIVSLPHFILTLLATQLVAILYTFVYRLVFSPLAKVPGPRLAALTSWYECYYDVILPGQYVFKIKELHNQYGPIVRINPRELSVSDLDFLDTIYAPGPSAKRNKDFEKTKALGINMGVSGAIDHHLHQKRRQSLNPYFSKKRVFNLEPQIQAKTAQLASIFTTSQEQNEVINLSDLYFAFSSDVISQYCFGHNQNVLANPARAASMRENVVTAVRGVKFNLHFSWVRSLIRMLPTRLTGRWVPAGIRDMIQLRKRIRQEIQRILDNKDNEGVENPHSIFYELRDSPTLPASEKMPQRLEDEAILLIMAGTESTAKSITIAHYHLLTNPNVMNQLRHELSTSPSSTLIELDQLPYLQGIALEANRLSFGLTGRNPRVSPDDTLKYTDGATDTTYVIPPGTPVSISTFIAHTNETIFPDPWTFNPGRWLCPEGQMRKKFMLGFGKGPRQCLGMHLANAELLSTIAEMAKWDMTLFETSEDDVKFLHDYHVASARLDSLGVRAIVGGKVRNETSVPDM